MKRTGLFQLSGIFLSLLTGVALLFAQNTLQSEPEEKQQGQGAKIEQVYEVYHPYFCSYTPRPFICRKCLSSGRRLARKIAFAKDGRPERIYYCLKRND